MSDLSLLQWIAGTPISWPEERKVMLVSLPINTQRFNVVKSAFRLIGVDLCPKGGNIDWDHIIFMKDLPQIHESGVYFGVHLALAVMKTSVYNHKKMTALEKLQEATIFEHVGGEGNCMVAGDKIKLDEQTIRSIYGVQVVGLTSCSDDEISRKCAFTFRHFIHEWQTEYQRDYRPLMSRWTYCPLWWNCHDLAIRLAYLLIAEDNRRPRSKELLARCLTNLKRCLVDQVLSRLQMLKRIPNMAEASLFLILAALYPPAAAGLLILRPVVNIDTLIDSTTSAAQVKRGAVKICRSMTRLQQQKGFDALRELDNKMRRALKRIDGVHQGRRSNSAIPEVSTPSSVDFGPLGWCSRSSSGNSKGRQQPNANGASWPRRHRTKMM